MVLVVVGFVKIRNKQHINSENLEQKKISVIVPVRNEEKNILECLLALEEQYYDENNFEVIVVNDHSSDGTVDKVNGFIQLHQINVHLFSLTEKTGKKEALQYGIEQSNYDLIATTDADCSLPKAWLKNITYHLNSETDMLLGPVIFTERKGFLSAFQLLDMLAIQGIEFGVLNYNNPILSNAANLSYSKKKFNLAGGFDTFNTPSGDDIFLLEKFKEKNYNIAGLLKNDFIVETEQECSVLGFLNQRLRWSSKTKYYSDKLLLYFGSIILIQNICLVFIYFGIPLVEKYSFTLIILLCCKWLIDFILLLLVSSFFQKRKALFYFIPVQIVYPFYIVIIWVASLTIRYEWKGRKF